MKLLLESQVVMELGLDVADKLEKTDDNRLLVGGNGLLHSIDLILGIATDLALNIFLSTEILLLESFELLLALLLVFLDLGLSFLFRLLRSLKLSLSRLVNLFSSTLLGSQKLLNSLGLRCHLEKGFGSEVKGYALKKRENK